MNVKIFDRDFNQYYRSLRFLDNIHKEFQNFKLIYLHKFNIFSILFFERILNYVYAFGLYMNFRKK